MHVVHIPDAHSGRRFCFARGPHAQIFLLAAFYPQAMSSLAEEFPDVPPSAEYKPSTSDVMCTTLANGMKVRLSCLCWCETTACFSYVLSRFHKFYIYLSRSFP